jgi:dTMP kinase
MMFPLKPAQRRHKFIVLEGMDGVGKSTIARGVVDRLRSQGESVLGLEGLQPPFDALREKIKTVSNVSARYFFYLASNFVASELVIKSIDHAWILCDRYIYSTQVYHAARGLETTIPLHVLDLAKPDYAFLIHLNNEGIRRDRVRNRGLPAPYDDEMFMGSPLWERIKAEYAIYDLTPIDNSGPTPRSAIEKICQIVLKSDDDAPTSP